MLITEVEDNVMGDSSLNTSKGIMRPGDNTQQSVIKQ